MPKSIDPKRVRVAFLALALLAGAGAPAFAEGTTALAVLDGAVRHSLELSEATLRAVPKTTLDVDFATGKGRETGRYAGALLWTLVEQADLVNEAGKNAVLRHTLLVTGRDGYAVSLSIGELDPHYAGKDVILAYEGGTPPVSPTNLRLVVPGDAHGGRSVRDVVRIEVK
ncbi:molybdopterin-dependent oxidoreductase [Kaistia terrae]|uniref:Molybdopterin-dependent oxidoreductase n=1 Tax=Kaistia terrae TaxID=537017 RepID=A0ABW0PQN9_9HYPH|nr:molybdopterin-dependent oxidoreductase [Kaistia terrae]MCX5578075.1 molybdopterin-dependent oxidoreductase [Kaistia terrae]